MSKLMLVMLMQQQFHVDLGVQLVIRYALSFHAQIFMFTKVKDGSLWVQN